MRAAEEARPGNDTPRPSRFRGWLAMGITFSPLLERVAGVGLSAAVLALGVVQLRIAKELEGPGRILLVVSESPS